MFYPPMDPNTAEEGSKAKWISLFYTAIPVGTAIGYVYSSLISAVLAGPGLHLGGCGHGALRDILFSASPSTPL